MEVEKKYRIGEIEEILAEMDFSDVDDDIAEIDEDFMIQISGWYLVIPSLGITEGVACVFDEEEKMFMPDFDVTVLYEGDSHIPADWMYYEQGKPIYQDVAYPVTKEFREKLYGQIISEYEKAKEQTQNQAQEKAAQTPVRPQEREATPFR